MLMCPMQYRRTLMQLSFCIAVALAAPQVRADKRVSVKVERSAELDAVLVGKSLVLAPAAGDCSRDFSELLARDLAAHGFSVVSREQAKAPAAVISLDATRCEARPREPLRGAGLPAVHISRTEGHVAIVLRVTDLDSGQELATTTVRGEAQKENQSQSGQPEYPSPPEVREMAVQQALVQARRLYLPWIDNREISFIDGKECNLRAAFELAKAADYPSLLRQSRANAAACASNPKFATEASYNLGVALLLNRQYEEALPALTAAGKIRGAAELMELCRKEKAARAARAPKPPEPLPGGTSQTGIILTNDFIIKMVQGNVAEDEILRMIAAQPGRFSFGPDDLVRLKAAGVSEAIVTAMRGKK